MGTLGQDADASFFTHVHHFLAAAHKESSVVAPTESAVDRRMAPRWPYSQSQRIAPGYCWEVPPDTAWIEIPCFDLTQGGFSFFMAEEPTFDHLVVQFRSSEAIYVAARIAHSRRVLVDPAGNILDAQVAAADALASLHLESKILIGCQFMRRFTK